MKIKNFITEMKAKQKKVQDTFQNCALFHICGIGLQGMFQTSEKILENNQEEKSQNCNKGHGFQIFMP